MKKIVASVGLAALGASTMQAADSSALSAAPPKFWNVSATLRGFYDDNINTAPSGTNKVDSFGFEVSPKVALNWQSDQTTAFLSYVYSLRYYDKRPLGNAQNYDQDHTFTGEFDHAFSERYRLSVSDSFVIGQEPDILRAPNQALADFQRLPGDNIRNYGAITLNADLTPVFGVEAGYANSFYDYHQSGAKDFGPILGVGQVVNGFFLPGPSVAGLLNRLDHAAHVDTRWTLSPETTGVIGYEYEQVNYTANEPVADLTKYPPPLMSDNRDTRSHKGYVGLDHTFRPDLTGSVRVGGEYTQFYNDPQHETDVSPYAKASLHYTYAMDSYLEGGFSYDRAAAALIGALGNSFTLDSEAAIIYATLNHRILPRLYGNVTGQFQNSDYNGGQFNGKSDRYYLVGLNLQYHFNPYLLGEVGYNYDKLDSDITGRTFDRNRVYIGVTASY